MEIRDWTILITAISFAVIIVWDLYVAFFNTIPNAVDTVSGIVIDWSAFLWVIPYAMGVLCGHLVMPNFLSGGFGFSGIALIFAVGITIIIFGLIGGRMLSRTKRDRALRAYGFLNLGMLMGNLFWGQ